MSGSVPCLSSGKRPAVMILPVMFYEKLLHKTTNIFHQSDRKIFIYFVILAYSHRAKKGD